MLGSHHGNLGLFAEALPANGSGIDRLSDLHVLFSPESCQALAGSRSKRLLSKIHSTAVPALDGWHSIMSDIPDPKTVEEEESYIHVRYRDSDQFERIRTPDWADDAADSVVEGSEVRMGELATSDDWQTQSVLIPAGTDEDTAREQADEIIRKIED